VSVDNNRVNFVYEGSRSSDAREAVRKVLPPLSNLVNPDGIEEELAHEVRLSSTDSYPVSQSSEQNQSATNDMEPGDDPAEVGSGPDGNSVRDSHDDPRGLNVNDDQLETISGGVSVESPVQDNDSDPKVLSSGVHFFSTSFFFKDFGSERSAVSVSTVRHALRIHQPYATGKENETGANQVEDE
jgi:hypothetical protein